MIDYTKDIINMQDYLFNGSVFEYDIRSAGYSILCAKHAIPEEEIQRLGNMTKSSRVVSIGMMIRDNPQLQDIISLGLINARKNFVEANKLHDSDIICIKKDAIFTTRKCNQLSFDGIDFRIKTRWRSYLRLGRIEFLFIDRDRFQINGLGERGIEFFRDNWIKSILEIIYRLSNADRSVKTYTSNLIMQYKGLTLDERYYHPFKSDPAGTDAMYNYSNVIIPLVKVITRVIGY